MSDTSTPVVLVVEDEPDVAETYRRWLQSTYDVRVAADGAAAMAQLDEFVDVVLLDRMMPEMSGDEVLRAVREQGVDCRVAMVTAVDPDFDVIEMGFDEYVSKPPERDELVATIEQLLNRSTFDDELQEYYSLVARRSALQAEKSESELATNEEYADLLARIEQRREAVDADLGDMSSDTQFVGVVRDIMDADSSTSTEGEGE